MKKGVLAFLIVVLVISGPAALWAEECGVCNIAESQSWGVSASGKIVRGVVNLGLGWTNILVQPFKESDHMMGIGKGFANFFVRAFQGAGEILTFWLPPTPSEPESQCALGDMGVTGR